MQKGYTQIYTGNGKGKTTAALGLITRAVGSNFKIFFCQFLKGRDYGELHTLKRFETVTHERYGRGVFIRSKEYVTDEDKKLIWGRFYQVNDSRNKKVNKGFGLGLSLVAKIIEQHNASIAVESELNKGTKFVTKFNLKIK